MDSRRNNILEAAGRVFLRYGVRRSGMTDIAEEAGISRQTLYNTFPSKNEVLGAAIRLNTERSIAQIAAELDNRPALSSRLDLIFDEMVLKPYDLLFASPNASDIVEGVNAEAKDALDESCRDYVALLERVLAPYEAELLAAGQSLSEMSEFVQVSAYATKKVARDRDHLLGVLQTLKALVLRTAGQSEG